jgi:hypothetical protein
MDGLVFLCMGISRQFSYDKLCFGTSPRTENPARRRNPAESCFLGLAGFSVLF